MRRARDYTMEGIGPEGDVRVVAGVKGKFFNREAIRAKLGAIMANAFSRFGAYVMTRARQSIRSRKRASRPGEPPTNRTGLLKEFIFFAYDPSADSVVIGPARLSKRGDAPAVLEHGGQAMVPVWGWRGKGADRRERIVGQRPIQIAPRLYMQQAFEREMERWPEILSQATEAGDAANWSAR